MKARTWVAGMMPLGLLLALGCGSPPNPSGTPGKAEPAANIPSPSANPGTSAAPPQPPPAPELVKPAYELDPAKHAIPAARVVGVASGVAFSPDVLVEDDSLVFRIFKPGATIPDRKVRIKLGPAANAKAFDGRPKVVVGRDMPPGPEVPEVYVDSPAGLHLYPNGYALTLELGRRQNWTIPGKIYLCLPDSEQTVLAGGFEAAYPRQPGEPPGPEDLPYIAGSVKVIGGPAKAVLRVGYFVEERPGVPYFASADLPVGDSMAAIGSIRVDDKPRITTVLAGDGKTEVARFEHSKLTTGRYLVYAMLLPTGPIAWTWVTVLPGETHTADLTIDATRTGGVEVNTPLEAVIDVHMVPADKPGFHVLERGPFQGAALQLNLVQKIIERKAMFKNLAPGRYNVLSSNGEIRDIEIIAGKTVELDFVKPTLPAPPKVVDPMAEPKKP